MYSMGDFGIKFASGFIDFGGLPPIICMPPDPKENLIVMTPIDAAIPDAEP